MFLLCHEQIPTIFSQQHAALAEPVLLWRQFCPAQILMKREYDEDIRSLRPHYSPLTNESLHYKAVQSRRNFTVYQPTSHLVCRTVSRLSHLFYLSSPPTTNSTIRLHIVNWKQTWDVSITSQSAPLIGDTLRSCFRWPCVYAKLCS